MALTWRRIADKLELARRASSRVTEAVRIGKGLINVASREGIKLVDLSPDDEDVRYRARKIVVIAKLEARRLLREARAPKVPAKTVAKTVAKKAPKDKVVDKPVALVEPIKPAETSDSDVEIF